MVPALAPSRRLPLIPRRTRRRGPRRAGQRADQDRGGFVIASIHNRYHLDRTEMTARIVRAMSHPCFEIWGHPLGRLLLRRAPVECEAHP